MLSAEESGIEENIAKNSLDASKQVKFNIGKSPI
jgi:hypothetical protein